MLRISALNEELSEESSDGDEPLKEKPTKEAEEAEALSWYKEALELRQKNDFNAALKLFHQTLALPCIENTPELPDEKVGDTPNISNEPGSSASEQIKYACLKNIATLYTQKGLLLEAVEAYLEAVEVDPFDVTVWYNIGKMATELKNFQLARHTFLQALACSPNHWPSLDGLISVLFGIGDDTACLFYINQALERDSYYIKGLVLRDAIFEDIPWLKEDIKSFPNNSWTPLFESCPYSESEKLEYLQEARALRQMVAGQYRQVVLPSVPLTKKVESSTWTALGQSLVATYNWISSTEGLKLSCPVDLESAKNTEEIIPEEVKPEALQEEPPAQSEAVVEKMELGEQEPAPAVELDASLQKQGSGKSSSNEDVTKMETDAAVIPSENPPAEPSKSKKPKDDTSTGLSDKENLQRRSTRSRAYAEQAEEDIYSLRAELRSFLPTSLLLGDISEEKSQVEATKVLDEPVMSQVCNPDLLASFSVTEEKDVTDFLARGTQFGILELLNQYCSLVAKLDVEFWPLELGQVYKEAYQSMRPHFALSDAFRIGGDAMEECHRLQPVLAHAEILVSCLKSDPTASIPNWFMEDLTTLFQVADELDLYLSKASTFQARVFWLHHRWHSQKGRIQVAMNYLDLLKLCFSTDKSMSVCTRAIESPKVFNLATIQEMEDLLMRTMQLEDVERLHQERNFPQLVDILKATFGQNQSSKSRDQQEYRVPVDRPTQLEMLLDGLSYLEDFEQFLIWGEQCLDESVSAYLAAYNRKNADETAPNNDSEPLTSSWSKVVERISTELEGILRCKRTSLGNLDRRSLMRFAENLVHILSHQLEAPEAQSKIPLNSIVYWILLHRVIEYEENRLSSTKKEQEESDDEEDDAPLPCSTLFIISAHDLLGKRSWCMSGSLFAPYALEVLMRKRRTTRDPEDREELGRAIEQASYCALGYPMSKKIKNRYMADHGVVTNAPYTWSRALLLAEFFLPSTEELPEFDTVKPTSNAEQEVLLQKIAGLIPSELDPKNKLDDVQDFIQGRRANIPTYLKHSGMPPEVENVFYLLGDYNFKNKEWAKAIENYMLDIALVPDRFDSWAALALATGSRLETKLNSCERLKNVGAFFDRAEAALRCFRRALRLRPLQTTLWIEQGTTAYMLHSFCSQLLRNETDSLSIELFERVEKERERMLDIAHDCFLAADKAWLSDVEKGNGGDDERWLHHYMLGKVSEKRSRPLDEFVEHYQMAAKLLEESSATYPKKISYNTPAHLSVEALEIYYRIHSNCLKSLMSLEGAPSDPALSAGIYKQLQIASKSLFALGGRRSSLEQKEEVAPTEQKEGVKRKASKSEDEKVAKKLALDSSTTNNEGQPAPLEGRAAAIADVQYILNELLEQVVQVAKPQRDGFFSDEVPKEEKPMEIDAPKEEEVTKPKSPSSSSSSSSSSSGSSDSEDDSSSSSDTDVKDKEAEPTTKESTEQNTPAIPPAPELQLMVDMCLSAIKECVSRFPHFYKGLHRLAFYFYHSKKNRNIDACRELLFGRPLSASIAQMQQQQGVAQVRYLPTGIAGLFTEWRSNNFFHGIWRIPINEIDRPGCFAAHMGRSAALLLDVLRETRDHRLLMELALALQPEPEPDKKYLFDSEREQHASVALSLMQQVLKSRLQEIKDQESSTAASNTVSPQQGSPSSSKKLSLLMDAFRAHDRITRNLPGKEAPFSALLVETYKVYRGPKDNQNETDAILMEQALIFCRNKQAQSRVRVGGVRGGMASSLGVVSTRGKRGYGTGRRGRPPGSTGVRLTQIRDHQTPLSLSAAISSAGLPPSQDSASVMQEAMKLLQSAGGSAANLPQHLRNIPGISNLLAMFSNPSQSRSGSSSKPSTSSSSSSATAPSAAQPAAPAKPAPKKDPPAKPPQASTSGTSQPARPDPLLSQAFGGMAGMPSLAGLGAIDPTMLAMLSNPYLNPLSLLGAGGTTDPSYQQQLMSWMQSSMAQSYAASMSGLNPSFYSTSRGRGGMSRGMRKSSSSSSSSARPLPTKVGSSSSSTNTTTIKPVSTSSSAPVSTVMSTSNPAAKASTSSGIRPADLSSKPSASMDLSSKNRPSDLGSTSSKSVQRPDFVGKAVPSTSSSRPTEAHRPLGQLPMDLKMSLPQFDALKSSSSRPAQQQAPPAHSSSSVKPKSFTPPTLKKTSSSSGLPGNKQPPLRTASLPSIDVSKLIASLSPYDLNRLAKLDPIRAPKPVGGLSLGPEITVTATSSSSNAAQQPPKPKPAHSGASSSSSYVNNPVGKSKGGPLYLPTASSSTSSPSSRAQDFKNIAFSVLQNLPMSMSLLVNKPQQQQQQSSSSKTMDLARSNTSSSQPKSTSSAQGLKMTVGKSLSLTKTPIPQLPSSTTISAASSHQQQRSSGVPPAVSVLKKGPAMEAVKKTGGSSGDDSDVVVLD